MSLLDKRLFYKPFSYPWAFSAFETQQSMHWLPQEVEMDSDIRDWNTKLSLAEKNLLTQLFRFFTQGDISIAKAYNQVYTPLFGGNPEVQMMLNSFASSEAIHVAAYARLMDTIGMPEAEYSAFLEYDAMRNKYEYLEDVKVSSDLRSIAKSLAIYSAFTEGMMLFSSFAILMNFSRFGKLKGMSQIVTWSIRDETLHTDSMIKLFRAFISENKHIWKDDLKAEIYQIARDMVELEDKFIDLAFEQGGIEGLTADEVKLYIRYICDRRLLQLGLKANFKVKKNPLEWLDWVLNGIEFANFFESRSTEYSKAQTKGDWSEVYSNHSLTNLK